MKSSNYVCTLGPSNNSPRNIERFLYQGMSCVRLNMCHGTHQSHLQTLENLKVAKEKFFKKIGYESSVAVAVDIQGPSIRTGRNDEFHPHGLELKLNDIVVLNENPKFLEQPESNVVYIDTLIAANVSRELEVLIGEEIQLRIEDIFGEQITCKVYRGGILHNFMHVYIPNIKKFEQPLVTEKDKKDIEFAISIEADFIFVSYAKSAQHIEELRGLTGPRMKIFSKIQSLDSLDNMGEIIAKSDGMIAAFSHQFDTFMTLKIEKTLLNFCHILMKPCFFSLAYPINANSLYEFTNWYLEGGDGFVLIRDASKQNNISKKIMTNLENIKSNSTIAESEPSDGALQMMELSGMPKTINNYHSHPNLNDSTNWWEAAMESCITIAKLSDIQVIVVLHTTFEQMRLLNALRFQHQNCEVVIVVEQKDEQLARQINIFNNMTCMICDTQKQNEFKLALDFSIRRGFSKNGDSLLFFDGSQQSISVYSIPLNYKFEK